jgi:cytochrome c peroxidase
LETTQSNLDGTGRKIVWSQDSAPFLPMSNGSQRHSRAQANRVSVANIVKAIASFERTLLSGDSPYDEYRRGDDPEAISPLAKRGEALFFSEKAECFHCHGGFSFSGTVDYLGKASPEVEFHNTALYKQYPADAQGLAEFTQRKEDIGRFKAPSLRNIVLTAPYMHDGGIRTLEQAIEHYRVGGRGGDVPNKSEFIRPFALSAQEKADLIAFLKSLTDPNIANHAEWSDPWATVDTANNRISEVQGAGKRGGSLRGSRFDYSEARYRPRVA